MKRSTTLFSAALLACAVAATVFAQEEKEEKEPKAQPGTQTKEIQKESETPAKPATHDKAVEILKKVDAAIRAVHAVQYKGTVTATGAVATFVPPLEGTAIISGESGGSYQKFRFDVKVKTAGSEEAKRFTVGGDGDTYYLIDWQNKIAYEDLDPAVVGSDGQTARGLGMVEFIHPKPFSDEINAERAELKESIKIGGEDCYVIDVTYAGRGGRSIWYFSKKDLLPRRRDQVSTGSRSPEGTIERIITDLVVDPKLDDGVFKLDLPEGFKKTDEFAPTHRRMRPN